MRACSRHRALHDPLLRQCLNLRAASSDDVGHGAVSAAGRGVVKVFADAGGGAARALGFGGRMRGCGWTLAKVLIYLPSFIIWPLFVNLSMLPVLTTCHITHVPTLGTAKDCVGVMRPLVLEEDAIGLSDDLLDVDGAAAKVLHCPVLDQVVEDEERLDHELPQLRHGHRVQRHFHAQGELQLTTRHLNEEISCSSIKRCMVSPFAR